MTRFTNSLVASVPVGGRGASYASGTTCLRVHGVKIRCFAARLLTSAAPCVVASHMHGAHNSYTVWWHHVPACPASDSFSSFIACCSNRSPCAQDAPFRSIAFNSKSSSFVVVGGSSIRHWRVRAVRQEHRDAAQPVHASLQKLVWPLLPTAAIDVVKRMWGPLR